MRNREGCGLLRKGQRQLPDQNNNGVNENGKRSVLKFAREIATDPRIWAQQRPFAVRPASRDISENGKDRKLVVVVPKNERVVPEEKQAED